MAPGIHLAPSAGWLLLTCLALTGVSACSRATPRDLSADSITARVADANTGFPVAGANVLATWEMKSGFEGRDTTYVMVLEAVTDSAGQFTLPAWGPKRVTSPGTVLRSTPRFTIFKSGYRLGGGDNRGYTLQASSLHMRSDWDGKTFELRRFVGSEDDYAGYLSSYLMLEVNNLLRNGCHGRSIPRMLLGIDRQSKDFAMQKTRKSLPSLQETSDSYAPTCGLIADYVRGIKQ